MKLNYIIPAASVVEFELDSTCLQASMDDSGNPDMDIEDLPGGLWGVAFFLA